MVTQLIYPRDRPESSRALPTVTYARSMQTYIMATLCRVCILDRIGIDGSSSPSQWDMDVFRPLTT